MNRINNLSCSTVFTPFEINMLMRLFFRHIFALFRFTKISLSLNVGSYKKKMRGSLFFLIAQSLKYFLLLNSSIKIIFDLLVLALPFLAEVLKSLCSLILVTLECIINQNHYIMVFFCHFRFKTFFLILLLFCFA